MTDLDKYRQPRKEKKARQPVNASLNEELHEKLLVIISEFFPAEMEKEKPALAPGVKVAIDIAYDVIVQAKARKAAGNDGQGQQEGQSSPQTPPPPPVSP